MGNDGENISVRCSAAPLGPVVRRGDEWWPGGLAGPWLATTLHRWVRAATHTGCSLGSVQGPGPWQKKKGDLREQGQEKRPG